MNSDSRPTARRLAILAATLALMAVPVVHAAAQAPPPGELKGSGSFAGTEIVQDEEFTGSICFRATKTIFATRGIGTYYGRSASGQEVVYRAEVASGQQVYANGPIQLEFENTQTYYHGPYGTHGTTDASCAPATAGTPAPAEFRIFAPDHVYRLNGSGAQVPCVGHGTFARTGANDDPNWQAQWSLDADCTVVGNAAGTPGSGTARAGTVHTHTGLHAACFGPPCVDNVRVDYKQYLPFVGLHVATDGPATAAVGTPVAVTATVTDDGIPLANATVNVSVAGPAPAAPPAGAAVTDGSGKASFTFTAAATGAYTVTASVASGGETASGTHQVTFTPAPPPTVTLDGPTAAQTEENVTVTAALTNAGNPVPASQISFTVTGPGQATPPSGNALTDANGKASFTFAANRAGDYAVTASASVATQPASATRAVHLEINTFKLAGTLSPSNTLLDAAVVDPSGTYAYFAGSGVTKVDLRTFQIAGSLSSLGGAVLSAVIDPAGEFAYFGTNQSPGRVVKVDLRTFQQVGSITLNPARPEDPSDSGERDLRSAVIDPAGRYAYFGTYKNDLPGHVVKIDLATFQRVDGIILDSAETGLFSAVMDPAGRYAYFGAEGVGRTGGRIVKIDLATFQRVGAAGLDGEAENNLISAVIDPDGNFAYFGTSADGTNPIKPVHIVKVDLNTMERVGAMALDTNTVFIPSAVMDPGGRHAYFGATNIVQAPTGNEEHAFVVKVDLTTFQRVYTLPLPASEMGGLPSAVIDPQGQFAYFAKKAGSQVQNSPQKIVRVAVSRPPVSWLVARDDSYTTPFATPLSVPAATGVLANDDDTQDNDPLTANLVTYPANGDVTLNPNGSFTYTPDSSFSGTDTFTYSFDDGMNVSAPATVSITVGAAPQGVQAVSGGAFGFETNVSLFGGPAAVKGGPGSTCGQAGQPACADGQSPAVGLPPSGGDLSATDPDGNMGQYGPAYIFENHGPLTVRTQGATGPAGAVLSSASVRNIQDNDPFHAGAPDGEASSTCTATRTTLGGSTRIINGRLVTSTDVTTGEPTNEITFPHDWAPAPNTEYRGTLNHVGDSWRIVFNEQILGPEAITVNAVHLYLLGPTAVGDMIIGQSRCGVVTSAANTTPVGNDDAYTATAGRPLTVPAAGVLVNDTDAEGQPLTAAKLAGVRPPASGGGTWAFPAEPAHGRLDLRPDGSFTYTPNPGYSGPDAFTYLAQDSRGKSDPATVNLTVGAAPRLAVADFDGDGDTDRSVFRAGAWHAEGQPPAYFGLAGDLAVPGDYDGDGDLDRAVYRGGAWLIEGQPTVYFGLADDLAVPGDYDGDGDVDRAVFRASVGAWFIEGQPTAYLGSAGDIPVPGDYDGDGDTDIAVWRPSSGAWHVAGQATQWLGLDGDVPVPGDYDGDGTADRAVWRPASGGWYVVGQATQWLGLSGDVPVPGDYDANATTERAVWRPAVGGWHVDGKPAAYLGATGDQPLPLPAAAYRAVR